MLNPDIIFIKSFLDIKNPNGWFSPLGFCKKMTVQFVLSEEIRWVTSSQPGDISQNPHRLS
jgi:hypothetical protein